MDKSSNMVDKYTDDLGIYGDHRYFLHVRANPSFNQPSDFAVVVYYNDSSSKERVQIVRVDQAHGYTHIDQLYRRENQKPAVDWDIWDAVQQLKSNWRQYAESFHNK